MGWVRQGGAWRGGPRKGVARATGRPAGQTRELGAVLGEPMDPFGGRKMLCGGKEAAFPACQACWSRARPGGVVVERCGVGCSGVAGLRGGPTEGADIVRIGSLLDPDGETR